MKEMFLHNPSCSKSRAALAVLIEKGIHPPIREYLEDPLSKDVLSEIVQILGIRPVDLVRKNEAPWKAKGSDGLSDEEVLDLMVENPILIERPIYVRDAKAAIGRPPEKVIEVL